MLSFVILLVLAVLLVIGLIVKLSKLSLPKKVDVFICIVLPFLTVSAFIVMLFECSYRRAEDIKMLDKITNMLSLTLDYNMVFETNEEKYESVGSLIQLQSRLDEIALQDTLLSIISGNSEDISARIAKARNAVNSQLVRINRLNDYAGITYSLASEIRTNSIHIQEPFTTKLNTTNLIFSCTDTADNKLAARVCVFIGDSIVFDRQYNYRRINSITIPHNEGSAEIVWVGYITQEDNIYKYKYDIYGE